MVKNIEELKKSFSEFDLQSILVGLGVIFLVVAGIFYVRGRRQGQGQKPSPSHEEILVEEEGLVKKQGEEKQELSEAEQEELKEEAEAALAADDAETLALTSDGKTATVKRVFKDSRFYLSLKVDGLSSTDKGFYYQGWLYEEGKEPLSMGRLELGEKTASLYYFSSEDRSDYSSVKVTLEPENGDQEPGEAVLEGSF